ncbi:hypothetical protein [Natrinema sp. DC36]|uniref:hypothetical protein n=1 Tax=Natrinema sp. DC36 TaxID=2878680 RepID=UPI001CF06C27|nr:hypothetical protein [Natrinema sp. DC36]
MNGDYTPTRGLKLGIQKFRNDSNINNKDTIVATEKDNVGINQCTYDLEFRNRDVDCSENSSPIVRLLSIRGGIGLASTAILSKSVCLGKPSLLYTDEQVKIGGETERYHDLTAEWYPTEMDQNKIGEFRKIMHGKQFESHSIPLDTIEDYSKQYLINNLKRIDGDMEDENNDN